MLDAHSLGQGLSKLGYHLEPGELVDLASLLNADATGHIAQAQLAASLLDWPELQVRKLKLDGSRLCCLKLPRRPLKSQLW